ncbi:MAG: YhbY family RNA-binding protein [Proteobacteria bacterium]|nr:YhbY family RNA-binding protein [Pseudomonadota bacterium]
MLNQKDKKRFRAIGHHLSPIVTIGDKGLSTRVVSELARAIRDHELIKIKLLTGDRKERNVTIAEIQQQLGIEVVQSIGKVALIYKAAAKPDPALSNLHRTDVF